MFDRGFQIFFPKSTAYKTKWAIKICHEWQINRNVKVPVLDPGGTFKDYGDLSKVQSLSTDLANMDANALSYWPSNFVQEVANSEGKVYPARTLYGIICGIRRHLKETHGGKRSIKSFGLMLRIKVKKGRRIYVQCKIYLLFSSKTTIRISIFF